MAVSKEIKEAIITKNIILLQYFKGACCGRSGVFRHD